MTGSFPFQLVEKFGLSHEIFAKTGKKFSAKRLKGWPWFVFVLCSFVPDPLC
jgi:hypothetical protein